MLPRLALPPAPRTTVGRVCFALFALACVGVAFKSSTWLTSSFVLSDRETIVHLDLPSHINKLHIDIGPNFGPILPPKDEPGTAVLAVEPNIGVANALRERFQKREHDGRMFIMSAAVSGRPLSGGVASFRHYNRRGMSSSLSEAPGTTSRLAAAAAPSSPAQNRSAAAARPAVSAGSGEAPGAQMSSNTLSSEAEAKLQATATTTTSTATTAKNATVRQTKSKSSRPPWADPKYSREANPAAAGKTGVDFVPVVSLERLLAAVPPRVDIALLKVDAQGHDLGIVKSASVPTLRRVARLVTETYIGSAAKVRYKGVNNHVDAWVAYMNKAGYKLAVQPPAGKTIEWDAEWRRV